MKPRILFFFFSAFLAAGCGLVEPDGGRAGIRFSALDVGQGDALLLELPGNRVLLVDAGSENSGVDSLLENRGIGRIDDLVITHAHEDHYGNVRKVLGRIPVGRVLLNPLDAADPPGTAFGRLLNYIADTLKIDTAWLFRDRSLPGYSPCSVLCLWPDTVPLSEPAYDTVNARAIVLKITLGLGSVLLTGDIHFDVERELAGDERMSDISILKMAHHGSRTSSSSAFLSMVCAGTAVVSVGKNNSFGHPDTSVLSRLSALSGRVLRTDLDGTVTLWLNESGKIRFYD
jgi:competence protein ComEC